MKKKTALLSLITAIASTAHLLADEVVTFNGSKLVGTISGISDGVLTLETEFAGTLEIPMEQVETFSTEDTLSVRLESGDTVTGKVSTDDSGTVSVQGSEGSLKTPKEDIRISWLPGAMDPDIAALQRNWLFRAAVDASINQGNTEEIEARIALEAQLEGPTDRLRLYAQHESGETDGVTTERETIIGARYTTFFSEKWGWFVRSEAENDEFEDVDLRAIGAGGLSYKVYGDSKHYLDTTAGLAYQYTAYSTIDDEEVMGFDLGLLHHYEFENLIVTETEVNFLAAFDDPGSFRIEHDTWVQVPISGGGRWNIRAGVENDYVSEPGPGVDELDTMIYTSLGLTWD
ncbi:MAG: DUF481 domain-containing protein [Opitutales bacterium]